MMLPNNTGLQLLQAYATWLSDPRSSQPINLSTIAPIMSRLDSPSPPNEIFIDARKEDALLALSFLQAKMFLDEVWNVLFDFAHKFAQWRTLNDRDALLGTILKALLEKIPPEHHGRLVDAVISNINSMLSNDDQVAASFVIAFFAAFREVETADAFQSALTTNLLAVIKCTEQISQNQRAYSAVSMVVSSLSPSIAPDAAMSSLMQLAAALAAGIRVKRDPSKPLIDLFTETVRKCSQLWPGANTANIDSVSLLVVDLPNWASASVFGEVLSPVIDLIAISHSSEQSLQLLHRLRPTIDELSKMNLTEFPEYEHTARLYGLLLGRLILNCLGSERSNVISYVKGLQVSIPDNPKPSDTVTGGFHLSCPTALPIFGAVCEVVKDPDLAAHCFSIVARCFEKGPFGQRSRIFYDQMISIAANSGGVAALNGTLDILCRMYLEMEGLDGNSAALSTAFEDLVLACKDEPVKRELVTLSLLGLLVQKGVKLAELKPSQSSFLRQPPAALLELLLPAVASGLAGLSRIESISRQAFVELVQEFWFVALFHAYQPALRWPDSWVRHLSTIAVHSPVLIKERDRAEGNTAKVLLSQPLTFELRGHLAGLLPNCSGRIGELGTAQCLWLLSFHQSESMRVVGTDKFDSVVQYITDDIIADLDLSDFVNDLSIGIVKGWLDKTGRQHPLLIVDLAVSMVDLLGSIYERIHDAGISLLRFIISQDEQLLGEEAIWRALFSRLRLLSALKSREPGTRAPPELALFPGKDHITDVLYARRVFEDILAFFRSVATAAAKLSPDIWHEWVVEMIDELNDPVAGADLESLLDELLHSLLIDRQQPKRAHEGATLDGSRQLAHHLAWSLELTTLGNLEDEIGDIDGLRVAITASLDDLKKCRLLTNSWSSIVRKQPAKLYPIIAELGNILVSQYHRSGPILSQNVFMSKISMDPSQECPIEQLPVRPLCLFNLVSFLKIQLGRQTFNNSQCVGLFSLISEILMDVGLCWALGSGRRLVISAIVDFSLKVLLQIQRVHPESGHFKNRVFLFLQAFFEQPVDWFIESRRVLQLEMDLLKSCLFSMTKLARSGKRHQSVTELFSAFLSHDYRRIGALMNRPPEKPEENPDLKKLIPTATSISVSLAIQLCERMGDPADSTLREQLSKTLIKNPWLLFTCSTPTVMETVLQTNLDPGDGAIGKAVLPPSLLHFLPPCPCLTALAILRSPAYEQSPRWLNYAMRSLESFPPDLLFFYTPQITQAVRKDHLGYIETTILHIARTSSKLAHQIIWNMKANMYIDDLGTIPDPMKSKLEKLVEKIVAGLSDVPFYKREFDFFERVTGISGSLKTHIKKEKWEKKKKIDEELKKIPVDAGVYLPSNPESTVLDIDYESGRPLQSQAKAPFMATFRVRDVETQKEMWQSTIFKVGDDCRQDVLALQFIAAIKMILQSFGVNGYLYPYRVIASAPGCGVIEVIPHSQSRDQLGREKINSLYGYFTFKFGSDRTTRFGQARSALVRSMAAYSVVCYLLAIRDRHNGNIMIEEDGHLIHIDFGFILDIAPGGIRFESAPFKFTSEMLQVLGGRDSASFAHFQELCVQCFFTVRPYASLLCRLVEQMTESGLPCFSNNAERAVRNLRSRFKLEVDEGEARKWMESLVYQSCENVSTVLYDSYQHNRNGIPY